MSLKGETYYGRYQWLDSWIPNDENSIEYSSNGWLKTITIYGGLYYIDENTNLYFPHQWRRASAILQSHWERKEL